MLAHMLIAYAQMCIINNHAGVTSGARCLNSVLNVHLYVYPNFVHTISDGSGTNLLAHLLLKERCGSVVESLAGDLGVAGSSLAGGTAFCH